MSGMSGSMMAPEGVQQSSVDATRILPLLFGGTILISACLLFLVQPLISKMILPWFGGSASVWVTAMLFFQVSLLAGYLYAHLLTRFLRARPQVIVHSSLLALSLTLLPLVPAVRWLPKPGDDPMLAVFGILGSSIGLPYMLLAATSPLIQNWFSVRSKSALPYRYFALSNAGSMLALFAFPLAVEPRLTGHQQSLLWSSLFVGFAVMCVLSALLHLRTLPAAQPLRVVAGARTSLGLLVLWTALAGCASALLLVVTNLLTQNIAPMPLLWVVPLGIYLLTFILCFDSSVWYRRGLFLVAALPALAFIAASTKAIDDPTILKIVPLLGGALFIACMTCHGELARLKPPAAELTTFYLAIAAGGALGGAAVALAAPHLFPSTYETPIVLAVTAAVLLAAVWREHKAWAQPRLFQAIWVACASLSILVSLYAGRELYNSHRRARFMARNFYGPLRIDEFTTSARLRFRQLNHGTITHGTQGMDNNLRYTPTTYYGRASGVGLAWRVLEASGPIRMGVIGLGTGTLAAYGRAGDFIHFYDINPLVVDIARKRFTYVSDTLAKVEITLGDARLSLEQEAPQQLDLLVVDAFSGDAIPVHLLTAEAMRVYWKHLKPDGVLAFHVSNHYLDLAPVVAAGAKNSGKQTGLVENSEDDDKVGAFSSTWVLVTSRANFFTNKLLAREWESVPVPAGTRPWTDDYSNLWQSLKFED